MDSEMQRSMDDLLAREPVIDRLARELVELRHAATRLVWDAAAVLRRDSGIERAWLQESIERVNKVVEAQLAAAQARREVSRA